MERCYLWMLIWGAAALAQQFLPPACAPYLNGCLYNPGTVQAVAGSVANISYRDGAGQNRTFEVYVRVPVTAQGALPVVIWPDGGEGTTDKGRDQGLRYIENGMRNGCRSS